MQNTVQRVQALEQSVRALETSVNSLDTHLTQLATSLHPDALRQLTDHAGGVAWVPLVTSRCLDFYSRHRFNLMLFESVQRVTSRHKNEI